MWSVMRWAFVLMWCCTNKIWLVIDWVNAEAGKTVTIPSYDFCRLLPLLSTLSCISILMHIIAFSANFNKHSGDVGWGAETYQRNGSNLVMHPRRAVVWVPYSSFLLMVGKWRCKMTNVPGQKHHFLWNFLWGGSGEAGHNKKPTDHTVPLSSLKSFKKIKWIRILSVNNSADSGDHYITLHKSVFIWYSVYHLPCCTTLLPFVDYVAFNIMQCCITSFLEGLLLKGWDWAKIIFWFYMLMIFINSETKWKFCFLCLTMTSATVTLVWHHNVGHRCTLCNHCMKSFLNALLIHQFTTQTNHLENLRAHCHLKVTLRGAVKFTCVNRCLNCQNHLSKSQLNDDLCIHNLKEAVNA